MTGSDAGARGGALAVAASAVCFGVSIPLSAWTLDRVSSPFLLVAARFAFGGLVLLPAALRRDGVRDEWRKVGSCTVPLLAGYVMLTVALTRTTSTTAAFLSYLLVVIVPMMVAVVYRHLPSPALLVGIAVSVVGLDRLTGGFGAFGAGEALSLGAAVVFAVHVIVLGRIAASGEVDLTRLASFQLLGVGVLVAPVALVIDGPSTSRGFWIGAALVGLAGLGGLVLQSAGQQTIGPSRTALILMIDPVVAAAGGFWLGDRIGWRGTAGAALILAGVAIAELPARNSRAATS